MHLNVVLPQAPGLNVGMAAVDLGLVTAARRLEIDIIPWRIRALSDRAQSLDSDIDRRMDTGLGPSRMIDGDWPSGLDGPILYWGDFHHMAQYVRAVGRIIGGCSGYALARRYLLLDGVERDILERSATFGTTLIFNSTTDFLDDEYAPALRCFMKNNFISWFRDPISTLLAARLRDRDGVHMGVDPALLIDTEQVANSGMETGSIGLFLGRTEENHQGLGKVAARLSKAMKTDIEWIDWGDVAGFPVMRVPRGVSTRGQPGHTTAFETLSHLASCSAVVTDSYHLALISWHLGIPAVTVAAPMSSNIRSVNSGARWSWRDKRELAGSQYGALDFVIRSEEFLHSPDLDARIDYLVDIIGSGKVTRYVKRQIEGDVRTSLQDLAAGVAVLTGERSR